MSNERPHGNLIAVLQGFHLAMADPTIVNNTIADNPGEGIAADAASNPTIVNAILWGNGDDLVNATATYSDIEDGDIGTGNISADPLFVNPEGGDYHLRAGSPCVDAGDPAGVPRAPPDDMDGELRPYGAGVDIGADEYWPCVPLTEVTITGSPTETVGVPAIFMALVSPITATRPVTYAWEATGQAPQVHVGRHRHEGGHAHGAELRR